MNGMIGIIIHLLYIMILDGYKSTKNQMIIVVCVSFLHFLFGMENSIDIL